MTLQKTLPPLEICKKKPGIIKHTCKERYAKSNNSMQMNISKNTVISDLDNFKKLIGNCAQIKFFFRLQYLSKLMCLVFQVHILPFCGCLFCFLSYFVFAFCVVFEIYLVAFSNTEYINSLIQIFSAFSVTSVVLYKKSRKESQGFE